MRLLARAMVVFTLLGPVSAESAQVWSSCQTVTGVSNYLAYANSVVLSLSPGIPGCSAVGIAGAMIFSAGSGGVAADNVSSFLASGYVAYTSGHQVQIYYDNSTSSCLGVIISVGGVAGQCP